MTSHCRSARRTWSGLVRRAVATAALAALATACSNIEGDLDLAPLVRTARHPAPAIRDTDVLGPIFPHYDDERRDFQFWGARPLFTVENRPWAPSLTGERESVVSFIAPFGKYHSNPRTTQWRFSPLVWFTKERGAPGAVDTDFILFPIVWYGSTTIPPEAAGVAERSDTYFALFPLIGQIDSFLAYDRIQFVGWPIFQRLYKRVFEQEDEEALTSIALLIGWTTGWPRGGSWHVLPFYSQSVFTYPPNQAGRYPPGADPAQPLPVYDKKIFLWPFIHYQKKDLDRGPGKETTLFAIWPFFKHEWSYDHEFWTILHPFFRINREYPYMRDSHEAAREKEMTDEEAQADDNTNVLEDIFTQAVFRHIRTEDYERLRILLLLWAEYHTRPETKMESRMDSWAFLQPIGVWRRIAVEMEDGHGWRDKSWYVLAPIFYTIHRDWLDANGNETGREDHHWKLWPLFTWEDKADGYANFHVFTLLPLDVERYVKDFNDAWLPFVNLFGYERAPDAEGGRELYTSLFRLVKYYRDPDESSLSIPLLWTQREIRGATRTQFSWRTLGGLFGWEGEDAKDGTAASRTLRLFWLPIRVSGAEGASE